MPRPPPAGQVGAMDVGHPLVATIAAAMLLFRGVGPVLVLIAHGFLGNDTLIWPQ
jgi:hypothetical protein